VVVADFDGDSRHDFAELEHSRLVLRVWLSATERTAVIQTRTPIAAIAAADLDGDRRAELIGSGTSAALHVWKQRKHGFVPVAPHRRLPGAASGRAPRALDDAPANPRVADGRFGSAGAFVLAPMSPRFLAPSPRGVHALPVPAPLPRLAFPRFGPRPPPPFALE
jgi:hypothetical protein